MQITITSCVLLYVVMAGSSSAGFAEALVSMAWFEITKLGLLPTKSVNACQNEQSLFYRSTNGRKERYTMSCLVRGWTMNTCHSHMFYRKLKEFHLKIIAIHLLIWIFFVIYIMSLCIMVLSLNEHTATAVSAKDCLDHEVAPHKNWGALTPTTRILPWKFFHIRFLTENATTRYLNN